MGGCYHCGAGEGAVRMLEVVSGTYRGRQLELSLCDGCREEFDAATDIAVVDTIETD